MSNKKPRLYESKNDIAWAQAFFDLDVLAQIKELGTFEIDSKSMNLYREARLMAKLDFQSQLPRVFKKNNLSILPTSRGGYVIGAMDAYHKFATFQSTAIDFSYPEHIESVDFENVSSEGQAISCVYLSGILQHFLEDDSIEPTVGGRMGSGSFSFKIDCTNGSAITIAVENAQIEVDAGFEGRKLYLIEAKNFLSEDFIIRQLYYPFRCWSEKVHKDVELIFINTANNCFHLRKYSFRDKLNYSSIELAKSEKYRLGIANINLETILNIYRESGEIQKLEPRVPFPQADSFERVINLCELLYAEETSMSLGLLSEEYGFTLRQAGYYYNAARYLGLAAQKEGILELTPLGCEVMSLPINTRQLRFIEILLRHRVFKETFRYNIEKFGCPPSSLVQNLIRIDRPTLTDSTLRRRARTVTSWVRWIFSTISDH